VSRNAKIDITEICPLNSVKGRLQQTEQTEDRCGRVK